MKIIPLSLIPLLAAFLTGCDESASKATLEPAPENGAQFRKGEGLSLTDEMAKSIGLTVAEVSEERVAPMLTVSLQATQAGREISGWLTAEQATHIKPGMEIMMNDGSKGRVISLDPVDFEIVAETAMPIQPGIPVIATFHFPPGESATAVPRAALLTTAEGHFVYTKNGKFFVRTPVKIGATGTDHVEITDGLYSGDEIVTAPVKSLWLAELQVLRGGKACTCGH